MYLLTNYRIVSASGPYVYTSNADAYLVKATSKLPSNKDGYDSYSYSKSRLVAGSNYPMLAKNTLLAEQLRTGRKLAFQSTAGASVIPCKMDYRPSTLPVAFNAHDKAFKAESLKGKLLGVEIEYYPREGAKATPLAELVHDGSLNSGGREMRKLTWQDDNGRLAGLVNLKLNGRVDKACGLHVHVDVRHLAFDAQVATYDRLLGFMPMLKKLVPASRLRNTYCKWASNRTGRNAGNRYSAINFTSVRRHGTIEFRCQGGSTNTVKIESWALLCQYLVRMASMPEVVLPRTWLQFVAMLPQPLKSWVIIRQLNLAATGLQLDARSLSAADVQFNATTNS